MTKPTLRQADIDFADLLVRLADDLSEPLEPEYRALATATPIDPVADSAVEVVDIGQFLSETSRRDDSDTRVPFDIKVGDKVIIGRHGGTKVMEYSGEEVVILSFHSPRDVPAFVSAEDDDAEPDQ